MSEVITTPDTFEGRLRTTLHDGLQAVGIDAAVETEPVPNTLLHRVLVTSGQFEALGYLDRQELVWRIVSQAFPPDERQHISSIWTTTPDELEGN